MGPLGRCGPPGGGHGDSCSRRGLVQRDAPPIFFSVLPKRKRAVHGPKEKNAFCRAPAPSCLRAVEFGQHDVQQHQVKWGVFKGGQRRRPVPGRCGLIPRVPEIGPQQLLDVRLVLYDQNAFHVSSPGRSIPRNCEFGMEIFSILRRPARQKRKKRLCSFGTQALFADREREAEGGKTLPVAQTART